MMPDMSKVNGFLMFPCCNGVPIRIEVAPLEATRRFSFFHRPGREASGARILDVHGEARGGERVRLHEGLEGQRHGQRA